MLRELPVWEPCSALAALAKGKRPARGASLLLDRRQS